MGRLVCGGKVKGWRLWGGVARDEEEGEEEEEVGNWLGGCGIFSLLVLLGEGGLSVELIYLLDGSFTRGSFGGES